MKKSRIVATTFAFLVSSMVSAAFAAPLDPASLAYPIETIRGMAPAGADLAQYKMALAHKVPDADALKTASSNFIVHDFNGDGILDLAVIYEVDPVFVNYETHATCGDYDPSNYKSKCSMLPGARKFQVFLGEPDGRTELVLSKDDLILDADSGGIWGDPLMGLTLNKKGSILISVYGGSSWRWWHTDTIQFRGDAFYVVGQTDGGIHTLDPEHTEDRRDVNLITGQVSEVKASGPSVHSQIPLKPLVNVKDFVSPMFGH